ncbi:esterase-like activity of phytase family protein [Nocardioides rubriscoriae]|uniref:esterase-like activity of phytase family protein n=1 Tax=Nocardioides rubriscoriae TaxID=642762 RepID=UPI0011DF0A39|nr:esterase-like activity of phytase family protein [Nocardioides rubriscoriae]
MRPLGTSVAALVLAATAASTSAATSAERHHDPRPHDTRPATPTLAARAVLPADTFVPGSEPSGSFTGNPAAPFPGQPVQGFSGVHRLPGGDYLAMSDNGYGAKANSQDFQLRVHRIRPHTDTGTIEVRGGFTLSDPDRLVPFATWRDGGCQAAAAAGTLPAGYTCPTRDRQLTGWDFDIESMQLAPDGTIWFGEEFGPFLLHTDGRGRLLEAPLPTPGVKSPSNPTLAPGEQPNLANSKGFEGMAISPDGGRLHAMLEGPVAGDPATDLRVYDVRVGDHTADHRRPTRFTGAYDVYRLESPTNAIGDHIAVDKHRFLTIERDNGSGPTAAFKRIYLVDDRDRDHDGRLDKTLLVDLLDVADPDGVGGLGDPFTFPYVTIEDVELIDDDTIAVLNDNNYPGTGGRGAGVKDVTEYLEIDLPQPLRADHRLLVGE